MSTYRAPGFLVRKKNGNFRLVVDYTRINQKATISNLPVPRLSQFNAKVHGKKVFTQIDLKEAFYSIEIKESDRHKLAFQLGMSLWNQTAGVWDLVIPHQNSKTLLTNALMV